MPLPALCGAFFNAQEILNRDVNRAFCHSVKRDDVEIAFYRIKVPHRPFALAEINYIAIIEVVWGGVNVLKSRIDVH